MRDSYEETKRAPPREFYNFFNSTYQLINYIKCLAKEKKN